MGKNKPIEHRPAATLKLDLKGQLAKVREAVVQVPAMVDGAVLALRNNGRARRVELVVEVGEDEVADRNANGVSNPAHLVGPWLADGVVQVTQNGGEGIEDLRGDHLLDVVDELFHGLGVLLDNVSPAVLWGHAEVDRVLWHRVCSSICRLRVFFVAKRGKGGRAGGAGGEAGAGGGTRRDIGVVSKTSTFQVKHTHRHTHTDTPTHTDTHRHTPTL